MPRTAPLAAALLAATAAAHYALTDPIVFDAVFCLTHNSDLYDAGLFNVSQLEEHWLSDEGLNDDRVGSGAWRAAAYLERYADVDALYGGDDEPYANTPPNFTAAATHWFQYGDDEEREGYVEGGYDGRYTVSADHRLYVSTSDRAAGAIDSIMFDGVEYLLNWHLVSLLGLHVADDNCVYVASGVYQPQDDYTATASSRLHKDYDIDAAHSQLVALGQRVDLGADGGRAVGLGADEGLLPVGVLDELAVIVEPVDCVERDRQGDGRLPVALHRAQLGDRSREPDVHAPARHLRHVRRVLQHLRRRHRVSGRAGRRGGLHAGPGRRRAVGCAAGRGQRGAGRGGFGGGRGVAGVVGRSWVAS